MPDTIVYHSIDGVIDIEMVAAMSNSVLVAMLVPFDSVEVPVGGSVRRSS
jgi:hypothetical protein